MAMTATQLGSLLGLGAAATNKLLRDHGFLEGDPGSWQPTELGKPFAHALGDDNGYGGYAHRSWSWFSWDGSILDALKASMEANPDGVAAVAKAPTTIAGGGPSPGSGACAQGSGTNKWVVMGAFGVVAVSAPAVRRVWNQKVRPAAAQTWARITEQAPSLSAAEAAEDSVGNARGD